MDTGENHLDAQADRYYDGAGRRQRLILIVVALGGILSLVLGTIGFLHLLDFHVNFWSMLDAIYDSLSLFHMHYDFGQIKVQLPGELQVARFLAPFVLVVTLLQGFLFVARRHTHALRHRSQRGHVVICGLGQKGLQLARQYRSQGEWVILIENDPLNPLLQLCDDEGIYCRVGDATQASVLRQARVIHAKEVVVVTPEDETNVRIATEIRRLCVQQNRAGLGCFVHLENIHLRERLQRIVENESRQKAGCALHFFDVYDSEARRVLLELRLDGGGISKDDRRSVHVVILGFGRMGRSLALRAVKMGHFANGKRLRISVIDRCADHQRERILFHYPVLEKGAICEMNFYQADVQSLAARRRVEAWAAEPDALLHLFVCLDDNASAVEAALRLQEALSNLATCNLCVRVKTRASLAQILPAPSAAGGPRMVAFGMVEDACCDQAFRHEYNENLARFAHEEFVRNRLADSNRASSNDPALLPWDELREDFRESCRQQADHLGIKLRAIGCEMAAMTDGRAPVTKFRAHEIELLAELEHRRWNAERWLAGWRYGTPTDKDRRVNANLVSWSELDDSIKKYDREAIEGIPARLKLANPPLKLVKGASDAAP